MIITHAPTAISALLVLTPVLTLEQLCCWAGQKDNSVIVGWFCLPTQVDKCTLFQCRVCRITINYLEWKVSRLCVTIRYFSFRLSLMNKPYSTLQLQSKTFNKLPPSNQQLLVSHFPIMNRDGSRGSSWQKKQLSLRWNWMQVQSQQISHWQGNIYEIPTHQPANQPSSLPTTGCSKVF